MTIANITLFQALGAKMDYINQRQNQIAQNVANADTPGYEPQDLVPVDFGRVLQNVTDGQQAKNVSVATTDSKHMPMADAIRDPRARDQKETYEVAPTGNAVIMEEQLLNAGRNVMDYNLITNILQKNVGLITTSLGNR